MNLITQIGNFTLPMLISSIIAAIFTIWVDPQTPGGIFIIFLISFAIILAACLMFIKIFGRKFEKPENGHLNKKNTVNVKNVFHSKNRKIRK